MRITQSWLKTSRKGLQLETLNWDGQSGQQNDKRAEHTQNKWTKLVLINRTITGQEKKKR